MVNMPNLNAVEAMGKQFTTNVFQNVASNLNKRANVASRRAAAANRQQTAAQPTQHTPAPLPTQPVGNLKANSVNAGRYRRQQRAQAAQNPVTPTANTRTTSYAPGAAPALNPVSPTAMAAGRARRQQNSQTGQTLARVSSIRQNLAAVPAHASPAPTNTVPSSLPGTGKHRANTTPNVPNAMPATPLSGGMQWTPLHSSGAGTGARRAATPTVVSPSSAPGVGRHRAGGVPNVATPAAAPKPATPVVQSLQMRGQIAPAPAAPSSGPKHAAPTPKLSGPVAPSSIIPRVASTPSGLPAKTSGTTVGSSVHQEMQRRMNTPPATARPQQFSGYPQHTHPEGSSQEVLPTLSANQSRPGRPNTFTVGSRKPGSNVQGIGAMGSRLEASLMRNPIGLPEKKRRV